MRGVQKVPPELLFWFIELCAPHVQQKIHSKTVYWDLTGSPNSFKPPSNTASLHPFSLPGAAAHLQVIGKWPHASTAYKADRLLLVRGCFDEMPPSWKRRAARPGAYTPDLSRKVADSGAEGTGGGSYLPQRPECLWCQGMQLQKPEMCVRETETAAAPSAQTTGLLCARWLQRCPHLHWVCLLCFLLLIFLNGKHGNIISPVNGLFCCDAAQTWTLGKTIPDQELNHLCFCLTPAQYFPGKRGFCSDFLKPNLSGPIKPALCRVIECSKHSLFSDPFICWAFSFGSLSYAWEIFSGVLGIGGDDQITHIKHNFWSEVIQTDWWPFVFFDWAWGYCWCDHWPAFECICCTNCVLSLHNGLLSFFLPSDVKRIQKTEEVQPECRKKT